MSRVFLTARGCPIADVKHWWSPSRPPRLKHWDTCTCWLRHSHPLLLPSPAFLVSHAGRLFSLQPFLRSANCPSQRFNRSQNLVIMTIIVRDQSNDIVPWLRAWFGVGFRGHYVPCAVSPLPSCNSTRMTNRISSVTSIWDSKKECIIQPQLNLKKILPVLLLFFPPSVVVVDKMRERAGFKFFGKRRMWDVAAG